MQLAFRRVGKGIPLILLHGLYGSGDNWMTLANRLSDLCEVWMPDLRNHGRSPHSSEHTYPAMADDLSAFIDAHGLVSPWILGHSMGGKVALQFASSFPQVPAGLIIADIAPVHYAQLTQSSAHVTAHLNIMQGLLSIDLSRLTSREEAEQQLASYIADPALCRFLLKNLYRTQGKEWGWRLNPDLLQKALPHIVNGMEHFLPDAIPSALPLHFLKGARSGYIGEAETDYIARHFPQACLHVCEEAGHWLHADAPEWVEARIRGALFSTPLP